MARREIEQRNIRSISKSGNGSFYITLPIEMIRNLKWRERQKLVVDQKGKTLVIKDWKK